MVQYVHQTPHPRFIAPMECLRMSKLPEGAQWIYEVKWDGYRIIAVKDGKHAAVYSRNGEDFSERFPSVVFALKELNVSRAIFDGEMVALDANGRASFQELQNYKSTRHQITYYIFDLLHANGADLIDDALSERRARLEKLAARFADPLRLSDVFRTDLHTFTQSAKQLGLEGIVAKNLKSTYESGKRSGNWAKKKLKKRATFVIGGYIPGGRHGLEQIILGEMTGGKLHFVNKTDRGFNPMLRREVFERLEPLAQSKCPFVNLPEKGSGPHKLTATRMKECVWVRPELQAEIDFDERTASGDLRHPEFRRLVE
jgi:bifunctional non-homologous end joining protein LigD